ncbi:rhodanese-like domain-containing protein [Natronomonas sp.]|uniref:rhodanese-like domain-containing protein n=1 Tax=Natronomonas sp. TaxID=2184060 RepID=UPI003975A9D8
MDGEITAEELRELLETDADIAIIDIRSPVQFRRGHIPGSENVPFPQLTGRIDEFAGRERIVTVCPHGQSSVQAARLIASYEGVDGRVESLKPGVDGWPYDLETDAEPTTPSADGPDAPF